MHHLSRSSHATPSCPGRSRNVGSSGRTRPAAVVVAALCAIGLVVSFGLIGSQSGVADAAPALRADPTVVDTTSPEVTAPTTISAATSPPSTGQVTSPATSPPATSSGRGSGSGQSGGDSVGSGNNASQGTTPALRSPQGTAAPSTSIDVTMTTTENLLIGPPPSTAAPTTIPQQNLNSTAVARKSAGSDPKIWAVVAGLVLLAIALGIATAMYWRRTDPRDIADDDEDGGGKRRQSRYSDLVITVPKSG